MTGSLLVDAAEIGTSPGPGARLPSLSRWSPVVLCHLLINEVCGGEGVLLGQATHLSAVVVGFIFFFSKCLEGLHCVVWDGTGGRNASRIAPPQSTLCPSVLAPGPDASPNTACIWYTFCVPDPGLLQNILISLLEFPFRPKGLLKKLGDEWKGRILERS